MNLINLKQSSLLLGFFALSVSACRKKSLYQIRISVTDANTSRVWKDTVGLTKNGGWEYSVNKDKNANSMDRAKLGGALVINGGSSQGGKDAIAYYPSSLTEEQVITKLASEQESNPNDAVIKGVEIRYIRKGKEVILEKGEKFEFGSEFAQSIDIPRKATFIIKATGEQTGETIAKPRSNWWASGDRYYSLSKKEANEIANIKNSQSNNHNQQPDNAQGIFDLGHLTGNIQQLPSSYAGLAAQAYAIEGVGKRLDDARVSLKIEVLKNGAVVFSKSITHSKLAELTVSGTAK